MVRLSVHHLAGFVMIVVGTALPPEGFYASLCDGKRFFELMPKI
jgi:hypothetical protein